MHRIVNRPFFAVDVLVIGAAVILLALLFSTVLAGALQRFLFG